MLTQSLFPRNPICCVLFVKKRSRIPHYLFTFPIINWCIYIVKLDYLIRLCLLDWLYSLFVYPSIEIVGFHPIGPLSCSWGMRFPSQIVHLIRWFYPPLCLVESFTSNIEWYTYLINTMVFNNSLFG